MIALSYGLFLSIDIILYSLLGIGIATIASPVINWFSNKTGVPRSLGTIIFYLLISLFLVIIVGSLAWISSEQFGELYNKIPEIRENLQTQLNPIIQKIGGTKSILQKLNISESIEGILTTTISALRIGVNLVAGLSLSLIISFYICITPDFYNRQLRLILPLSDDDEAQEYLTEVAKGLRQWFKAQLIDMLLISLLTAIGLWITGFRYWLAIGLLTGLFCIVPYLGILIIATVSVFISLGQDPHQALWVLLVFFITQQIEGTLILPKLMRENASLPEVPLIIFIILMGGWFGILGIFMAPGILTVALSLINIHRKSKEKILVTQE